MNYSFFNMMSPQMQQQVQYHVQQARQSGNSKEYVERVFGNCPMFPEGYSLFNQKGIQSLDNFIASKLK